jgi:outer membrane protein assembly factor BamA
MKSSGSKDRAGKITAAIVVLAVILPAGPVFAQDGDAAGPDSTAADTGGFMLLPIIFYTPETELAAGASVMRYFRSEGADMKARPSEIWATFIYTQRSQYIADLSSLLYFDDERYLTHANINYQKFPNTFWGVGPATPDSLEESYTPTTLFVFTSVRNRVNAGFHVGPQYEFAYSRISDTEQGGLLDSGFIPGSQGGTVSGVGAFIAWDTRDNVYYPTAGSYHTASVSVYGSALGSDFDFAKYIVDVRWYAALSQKFVLAVRGNFDASTGVVPFQKMAMLGGQYTLRGYYQGRYRDRFGAVAQLELRARLFWRVGMAAFAGVGNVAGRLDDFDRDTIRYSAGFGIRYTFDKSEGMNLRLDFGWAKDGSTGMYITAMEAF